MNTLTPFYYAAAVVNKKTNQCISFMFMNDSISEVEACIKRVLKDGQHLKYEFIVCIRDNDQRYTNYLYELQLSDGCFVRNMVTPHDNIHF